MSVAYVVRSCEKTYCINHGDTEAQRKGPFFSVLSASAMKMASLTLHLRIRQLVIVR
jgi:hypothetical protein